MSLSPFSTTIAIVLLSTIVSAQGQAPVSVQALRERAASGDAESQFRLGFMLASGEGIRADEKEALVWLRKAAEQQHPDAEYSLGEMILSGRGAAKNESDAFRWIERAALHGQSFAQMNVGVMYLNGIGVAPDPAKAFQWVSKAAERGIPGAEFGLGSMYSHGDGVTQDIEKAVVWYSKAAEHGDPSAQNNLAFLLATAKNPKLRNVVRATRIAQDLARTHPSEPVFLDTLATCYFEAGDNKNAAQTEQKALELNPGKTEYQSALKRYQLAAN